MNKDIIRKSTKKEGEALQDYLRIMRRHSVVPPKKGKGKNTIDRRKVKEAKKIFKKLLTNTPISSIIRL